MSTLLLTALLQLQITVAPQPPNNSAQSAVVVFDGVVNSQRQLDTPRSIEGLVPFVQPSLRSMGQWKFGPATPVGERVSITFLYRAHTLLPDNPRELNLARQASGPDRPALPTRIIDPGYPVNSIGEGPVILQLRIGVTGQVQNVMVARETPSLTELAVRAASQWKFTPAIVNGKPAASTAIIVIYFWRPVL
jgi:hypothetical protein